MHVHSSYALIVIFIVAGTSITSAFAIPISIETDNDVYDHSSIITVTGQIANLDPNYLAVALKVLSPNGNIVGVAQPGVNNDGSFMTTIETGGALWSQDGMYTISAYQGQATQYQASAEVEVIDGHVIPEFGTIAVMILVVAIVSIIIVSAKTKLSLVPRY